MPPRGPGWGVSHTPLGGQGRIALGHRSSDGHSVGSAPWWPRAYRTRPPEQRRTLRRLGPLVAKGVSHSATGAAPLCVLCVCVTRLSLALLCVCVCVCV